MNNSATEIMRVADYVVDSDMWDCTLWDVFHAHSGDETFAGDIKDLNKSFLYGADLLESDPENFETFNMGFIAGCGYGIDTLARWVTEKWDEEDE